MSITSPGSTRLLTLPCKRPSPFSETSPRGKRRRSEADNCDPPSVVFEKPPGRQYTPTSSPLLGLSPTNSPPLLHSSTITPATSPPVSSPVNQDVSIPKPADITNHEQCPVIRTFESEATDFPSSSLPISEVGSTVLDVPTQVLVFDSTQQDRHSDHIPISSQPSQSDSHHSKPDSQPLTSSLLQATNDHFPTPTLPPIVDITCCTAPSGAVVFETSPHGKVVDLVPVITAPLSELAGSVEGTKTPPPNPPHIDPCLAPGRLRSSQQLKADQPASPAENQPINRSSKPLSSSPIRPQDTPATRTISRNKLSTPFRSPVITNKTPDPNLPAISNSPLAPPKFKIPYTVPSKPQLLLDPSPQKQKHKAVGRLRSQPKFKSPFKSPLISTSATGPSSSGPSKFNIQLLERKLQLLKHAIKIKNDPNGDTKLEVLIERWRGVARDVAWEVWGIVKDGQQANPWDGGEEKKFSESMWGRQKPFDGNWGWDDRGKVEVDPEELEVWTPPPAHKIQRELERALETTTKIRVRLSDSGYNMEQEKQPELDKPTLGLMLKQLGIAYETLGWNDDEGDFVER